MAHFQNQHGALPRTDEYGNPVHQTDEYGNPIYHSSTTGDYGTGGFSTKTATGTLGHGGTTAVGTDLGREYHDQKHHELQRSGSSSSSSSSEDDGHGGRRKKKGLKEKIKEKLPGVGHKNERSQTSASTTPGGHHVTGEGQHYHHEKKGMMEKIKEKLPGHH